MKKRLLSILLVLCMICTLFPMSAFAADIVDKGSCGKNAKWTLDSDGVLTISGTGAIYDYSHEWDENPAPWVDYSREIKSIVIEDGITRIGNESFGTQRMSYQYSAETISISDSVREIGDLAFGECIKTVSLPKGIEYISDYAFSDCSVLQEIDIVGGKSDNGLYKTKDGVLYKSITESEGKWELLYYPNCKTDAEYIMPAGTVSLTEYAFSGNQYLKTAVIADGVKEIPIAAFNYCTALESVTIPESVTKIDGSAFWECNSLLRVDIPASVTDISCSLYFQEIGAMFADNDVAFYFYGNKAPYCEDIGYGSFGFAGGRESSYIPEGVTYGHVTVYYPKNATGWESIMELDNVKGNSCVSFETWDPNASLHTHSYTAVVTKPTCTERGYTTHTCSCGDSYVDSYVDPLGHNYVNGVCTRCGADDPNYKPTPVNPFTDIGSCSKSFQTAILWASSNGIAAGTSATTYNPNGSCTRGQVVTFLWRAAGKPEPTTMNNPYNDVASTAYYYKAILWAAENGITAGYNNPDGSKSFKPGDTVTRGQFVTFLWRYLGKPAPSTAVNPFNDVAPGGFYNAILWGSENGIVAGYNNADGTMSFKPNNPCTRAHVAVFLYRAMA